MPIYPYGECPNHPDQVIEDYRAIADRDLPMLCGCGAQLTRLPVAPVVQTLGTSMKGDARYDHSSGSYVDEHLPRKDGKFRTVTSLADKQRQLRETRRVEVGSVKDEGADRATTAGRISVSG